MSRGAAPPAAKRAAAVLVIVGVGVVAWGLRRGPGSVAPAAFAFFTFDRPGINAHTSPATAADPARPEVSVVADRIDTPEFSCSVSVSTDAGDNWDPLAVPLPPEAPNCYWPDVDFDGAGRLLVLYTATGGRFNLPVGVWLQAFRDGGPDGPPVAVAGPGAFHAHMAVRGSSVVVAYVQAAPATVDQGVGFAPGPNPVTVRRSADGGATFGAPVAVSDPAGRVVLPSVVFGPGEQVVVGALDLVDDVDDHEGRHEGQGGDPAPGRWRVVAFRSPDGGATFSAGTVAGEVEIPQRIIVNLGPVPAFAWDVARDRLYAAWDGGRGPARDVFLARSDDGGATWSEPSPVVRRTGTQQLPALGVAPGGRLDVLFYDRSADPTDEMTEVAMAVSWDGGRSFVTGTVSRQPFDAGIGFGSFQGIPVPSSQLATISRPGGTSAFWADARRATKLDNAQELALAQVEVRRRGDRRGPVAVGGAVLAGAGLTLAVRRR